MSLIHIKNAYSLVSALLVTFTDAGAAVGVAAGRLERASAEVTEMVIVFSAVFPMASVTPNVTEYCPMISSVYFPYQYNFSVILFPHVSYAFARCKRSSSDPTATVISEALICGEAFRHGLFASGSVGSQPAHSLSSGILIVSGFPRGPGVSASS